MGRAKRAALGAMLLGLAVWAGWTLNRRLVCASILLRLEGAKSPSWLVHYDEHAVEVTDHAFEGVAARLYSPRGVMHAPGVLLSHGMHEDGVREPRLIALARALAGAGYVVATPDVTGLAHYQITHDDVNRLARAARGLAKYVERSQVTVFGISFGGGLAIRAACEPANADAIGRVIALGAHHDAERVSRFYLGEPALGPTGERALVEPHPYGRVALWMSLFGEKHRGEFTESERVRVLRGVEGRTSELLRASPRGCRGALRVPLHLVHGSGNRVVPYTETLWNAQQFGRRNDVKTLISAAIVHAEYAPPSTSDRLRLIEFIAEALE